MRAKSGKYRWVSIWGEPVVDESGVLTRTVGGIQDIHDLVTARARLRATLDTEFDPHVVFEAVRDETGQIVDFTYVDANRAACAYNAMPYDELVGSQLLELLPGHRDSALLDMYRTVVETGEPMRVDGVEYENEFMRGEVRHYDIQAEKLDDGLSYTWRDVTDRIATAQALARSEEIHRLLTQNLSDVVVHLRDGIVAWVSPSLTATLGWDPEDWLSHRVIDYVDPDGLGDVEESRAALYRGEIELFRVRVRAKDGRFHWVQVHSKPYIKDGAPDGIVASFRNIDAEVAAEDDLEVRARSDELTGLLNRREVLERVAALTRHPRRSGEEAAVLFGDIDGFKTINDEFGHSAGDDVLQAVATRINSCLRTGDVAARIGGDEILILLDGVHELANAVDVADNIRRAVAQPIQTDDQTVSATLSIGVTLAVPGEDVDEMIARADRAMYEAKQAGGDRVVPRMPTPA
ncbi:diguanylate cyclase domain-containing protein [Pengzhenrongella phosphoraccumulans]|uniref:diguanylate cyclase domain-containing protein n=1 Tax=Pengzhenrongella phosphoraccumulans TaxID=3114394 RepID=UPI003890B7B0